MHMSLAEHLLFVKHDDAASIDKNKTSLILAARNIDSIGQSTFPEINLARSPNKRYFRASDEAFLRDAHEWIRRYKAPNFPLHPKSTRNGSDS